MKLRHANLTLCLPGIAALLLGSLPAQGLPQFVPLLKPVSFGVLLSPPQNVLTAPMPPLPPVMTSTAKTALGRGLLWSRAFDPSLWMTD